MEKKKTTSLWFKSECMQAKWRKKRLVPISL